MARSKLGGYLEPAGELLPFEFGGSRYFVLNVTRLGRLDKSKTKWETDDPLLPGDILEYGFKKPSIQKLGIFKIHETATTELFVVEGTKKPELEFRALVERHNLSGLLFEPVWSDE